jgi:hypothetical protein
MRTLFTLALAFCFHIVSGQTFEKNFVLSNNLKGLEYGNAGIELSNGNYLIGVNNSVLCLSASGDSLWKKTYANFGDILKIFRDNQGKLMLATTLGKMIILEINESNGDSVASFRPPGQFANSGYIIYDVKLLADGDYILLYTNGGGNGATICRFVPKATTAKWSRDYAGQNFAPRSILIDDTCLVLPGYKGNITTNWMFDIHVAKISVNNVPIWTKTFVRNNSSYRDRLMGIQKNNSGNYIVACNWIVNDRGCPAVFTLSPNGDSLSMSAYVAHGNESLNHGYAYSLERNGTNGFIAAGIINYNKKDPANKTKGMGHLTVLKISEEGVITQAVPFNNVGFFHYNTGYYDAAYAWGNGAFMTKDGNFLAYGVGNIVVPGSSPNSLETFYKSYVVKGKFSSTGQMEVGNEKQIVSIYPNPVSDKLFIKDENTIEHVKVYDMQGKMVLQVMPSEINGGIDIRQLPTAMYVITIVYKQGAQAHTQFVKID